MQEFSHSSRPMWNYEDRCRQQWESADITALLQFIGVLLQASLIFVIPKKEKRTLSEVSADRESGWRNKDEGLEEPLMDAVTG